MSDLPKDMSINIKRQLEKDLIIFGNSYYIKKTIIKTDKRELYEYTIVDPLEIEIVKKDFKNV